MVLRPRWRTAAAVVVLLAALVAGWVGSNIWRRANAEGSRFVDLQGTVIEPDAPGRLCVQFDRESVKPADNAFGAPGSDVGFCGLVITPPPPGTKVLATAALSPPGLGDRNQSVWVRIERRP